MAQSCGALPVAITPRQAVFSSPPLAARSFSATSYEAPYKQITDGYIFSSLLSSLRKRQSVPCAMSLLGLLLTSPTSRSRSE